MPGSGGPAPDPAAVAAELYRVPPESFVAERDARVAEAREAGDKAAAKEIGGLKRPTRAAWLTNLLVADALDEVEGLLGLADTLADAQRSLDGAALRQVSAQRSKLVGALARRAAGLGRDAGQRIDHSLEREVRTVLESALADPGLAEEVRSGRLVRFERHSGFGPAPEGSAPTKAGARTSRDRPVRRPGTTGDGAAGPVEDGADDAVRGTRDDERDRRDRERRDRLVAEAEERLARASAAADATATERTDARERADAAAGARDEARRRVDELVDELDRARDTATEADRAAKSAERSASAAARRAREADAAVARAEEHLRNAQR